MAGLGAEPLAEFVGGVLGHGDGGVAVLAHAEGHVGVGRGGAADGIHRRVGGVGGLFAAVFPAGIGGDHEGHVEVPGDLGGPHPERFDFHFHLRAFVRFAVLFGVGAAHEKFAAGNGHHGKFLAGFLDGFRCRL